MKATIGIILTIATLCIATATNATAQNNNDNRVIISNTTTSITLPKHFEYDSLTNRIAHTGTMSQIQVNKVTNRPYKKIAAAITNEYMASQGFELIDTQECKMQSGDDAVIFKSRFKSHDENGNEMYFTRLILLTGNTNTIWITADFPECISKQIEEVIRESLTSAEDEQ